MKLSSEYLMSGKGLELLGKLFHSSGEGIMLFNEKAEIEMVNPRSQEMFGYTEKELAGELVEKLVPEAVRAKHVPYRNNYLKSPNPRPMGHGLDLKGQRKDGSTFPIEISLNYLKHEEETLVVAFITDITVRKKNERMVEEQQKKLGEYADELERKVKSRTSELEHMNMGLQSQIQERKLAEKALKESLQDLKKAEKEILMSLEREKELGVLKSRFVSMASHEFRTPLTTILSSANLIGKYVESDQQISREKHVDRITKSVQNLTNILNDFLSLEKLESGALSTTKSDLDLKELLEEISEDMRGTFKEGQEIKLTCSSILVHSDEHILRNILFNLISNASKYSSVNSLIEISAKQKKDYVCIMVVDVGMGIPKEEQKNLFERFFRAGNVTNIQGTGLGLNIVKKYVDLLGGQIEFESQEGKGSTFEVKLPSS
ncbi:MAG: PAS domain-containing sensor histidine kinase [Cyclobacteriaceae bacterium]